MNDLILIESQSARTEKMSGVTDNRAIEHLNKAKALTMALHQGTGVATTRQMAEYYEIPEDTVQTFVKTNRDELVSDGLKTVKGQELKDVVSILNTTSDKAPSLTIWTPRAALRLGMLLRDSPIAKAVRTVLLNIVESKTAPHPTHTIHDEIRKLELQVELKKLELGIYAPPRETYPPITPAIAPLPHLPAIAVQQELDIDIVQRYNESKAALLKAKTLDNEYKALSIAPKLKNDLTGIDNIESVQAYIRDRTKLDPNAKVYIGKADGNPATHFYPNYLQYCTDQGLSFVAMQRFSKALMQLVYITMEVRLWKGKDRVGCHVKGIAIAA